ncbi:hypothetical protein NDI44_19620 [Trichocoleus sp. DQ-A3]|uniref:hypothetical protein n=1 Tax=Cyanophyceae TaxID=3028117 RepID=UPI001686E77D|nr:MULTISPECIES: hypothetical protein [unclassified Coleofasciculus]MBD1889233.1 hypothetical protein [Coleofasciculus sp. FACHB-SPT9]MBD1899346.1 hypothetical protein [Coleofasciculus sp. FACHB-125]
MKGEKSVPSQDDTAPDNYTDKRSRYHCLKPKLRAFCKDEWMAMVTTAVVPEVVSQGFSVAVDELLD